MGQVGKPTSRQVRELPGTNLRDPDVERPVAVAEEDDELSVSGDRGIDLRPFEIRQLVEVRVLQRILPEQLRLPQESCSCRKQQKG